MSFVITFERLMINCTVGGYLLIVFVSVCCQCYLFAMQLYGQYRLRLLELYQPLTPFPTTAP